MRLKHRIAKLEDGYRVRLEAEQITLTPQERERVDRLVADIVAHPEENPEGFAALQKVLGQPID